MGSPYHKYFGIQEGAVMVGGGWECECEAQGRLFAEDSHLSPIVIENSSQWRECRVEGERIFVAIHGHLSVGKSLSLTNFFVVITVALKDLSLPNAITMTGEKIRPQSYHKHEKSSCPLL